MRSTRLPAARVPSALRLLAAGLALACASTLALAKPEPAEPMLAERASDMVVTAMNFLGVPYKRGGSNEDSGFDCSGFTRHVFGMTLGLALPRRVDEQASAPGLVPIKRDELKPGDLVFFNTLKRTFSHVGIYIGEGKFIHSPRSGGEVRVEEMGLAYWKKRFTGARRVLREAILPKAASTTADVKQSPFASPQAHAPAEAPELSGNPASNTHRD